MKAAFYECDITPPLGGFMWGHYKKVLATDVQDRLYAKAVVTEQDGQYAALVCIDSCSLPPEMHDAVTRRVAEFTEIPAESVCLTSNHTHWGASICDSPEIGCYADAAFKDVCFRLTADAVILAYLRLKNATVTYGTSELLGVSFNRNYVYEDGTADTFKKKTLAVTGQLAGIDPSVSVLTFYDGDRPMGALINYALHQCCCGRTTGYTGDYSSILSKELKKKYGEDFVSLFVLGCCGDINHIPNDGQNMPTEETYRDIGRALAEKASAAMTSAKPAGEGVRAVKKKIRIPTRQIDVGEAKERLNELLATDRNLMRARNLVYYQAYNEDDHKDLWLQAFQIGSVCIYALPGEIFVNHGLRLKKESAHTDCMVVENCNDYCGYVPTKEAFNENYDLYETTLCYHSCLVPEAGDMIVDQLLQMI